MSKQKARRAAFLPKTTTLLTLAKWPMGDSMRYLETISENMRESWSKHSVEVGILDSVLDFYLQIEMQPYDKAFVTDTCIKAFILS